ncbi:hybrid sensor histidine kinase/response regulator [Roseospira visakhapatnamensis]|uniref:histidine kinase n=1 Tax=Roseospira visakhapatnamensis TaxID=390880 RepID=A0A7W6RCX6_9PROT|nr:hybrid sensor histidine kinase/response regulator [Roseospira visakhapatnamensis]MBB4266230.1 signal transduction histidine kinase/DNA-binding response OmpR family regulator [Roseospira visakhapatnamensis]
MLKFSEYSIRGKMNAVIFFSNALLLVIIAASFSVWSYLAYKQSLESRMMAVAGQLANATPLGVATDNHGAVGAFLNGYDHEKAIAVATILDRDLNLMTRADGSPFAIYVRGDQPLARPAPADPWAVLPGDLGPVVARALATLGAETAGERDATRAVTWAGNRALVVHPLMYEGGLIGHVLILSDLHPFWDLALDRAPFFALALLGLLAVAFLVADRVQRLVTKPIVDLARTVRAITDGQRFDQQIEGRRYSGELAEFVLDFNALLRVVNARDKALERSNATLAKRVEERTAELLRKNKALAVASEQAQAANIAKTQFVQVITHELRTPLNAIKGYNDMLLDTFEDEDDDDEEIDREEVLHCLNQTRLAVRHNIDLVNQVLDFSSIEAGKLTVQPRTHDLREILAEIESTIFEYAKKNDNRVRLDIADGVGEIETDKTRLKQCLINVMGNACKFTEKGEITLSVDVRERSGVPWVRFVVRDTGVGIPPDKLQTIFEPFSQVDSSMSRKFPGTGLGLALVKKVVTMFGGRVWAESAEGQGSAFFIEVPRTLGAGTVAEGAAAAALAPPAQDPASPCTARPGAPDAAADPARDRTRPLVLLIDDDPAFHDRLRPALVDQGYRTAHAYNGEEGLAQARELAPLAILLDIIMPGKDGWQVLEEVKTDPALSRIPVVVATMAGNADLAITLGAADVFPKPLDADLLMACLDRWRFDGRSAHALVIDDDAFTRDLLRRGLEKHGWTVTEAADGRQGLAALESTGAPAVILLDLMMPEVDGFQVVRRLRERPDWAAIPVIVMTAKDLSREEQAFLNANVGSVLEKGTFEARALLAQIEGLVGVTATDDDAGSPPGPTPP